MRFIAWCFLLIFLISFPFLNLIAYEDPQETITISGGDTAYITGWIGSRTEQYFRSLDLTKIKRIDLSSFGGKLFYAMAIAEIVRNNNIETFVNAGQYCFSACAIIFQAGTKRIAHPSARFMYHYVYNRFGPELEIIEINEFASAIMFERLFKYGISPMLINRIRANKGIDIEIGVAEAIEYGVVTLIIR